MQPVSHGRLVFVRFQGRRSTSLIAEALDGLVPVAPGAKCAIIGPMVETKRYLIPAREVRVEITVVNSRFIATAAPALHVDEARAFVDRVKREFAGATHNVSAYVVGHGATVVAHCSDDGEPSGTAGRPALAVLEGSGLGDVAVVVTRYFGGTKLGTGGLVRAYGDAVREVLAALPRAVKVPTHTVTVVVPYSAFERVRRLVARHRGEILAEEFAAEVTVEARFPTERLAAFQAALCELSGGKLEAKVTGSEEATIVPVDPAAGKSPGKNPSPD